MRSLDISVEERSSRTAAEWLWPLLPIGVSVFCLSALVYYHLKHGLVEVRSALQVLIAGIYHSVGLAPAFLFFLLVGTWSTIWFVTGKLERPLLRLARLVAMAVMLGVFLNLGDGGVAAAAHKGELGAWLAGCLVAAFGYFPSIVLVWAITFASLLLATDFFFSDSFERLRQRPATGARGDEQGVETAVTDHLRGLAGAVPAPSTNAPPGPFAAAPEFAFGSVATAGSAVADDVEVDADEVADTVEDDTLEAPEIEQPEIEQEGSMPRRRRSYFERRYEEAAAGDLGVAAAAEWAAEPAPSSDADGESDADRAAVADSQSDAYRGVETGEDVAAAAIEAAESEVPPTRPNAAVAGDLQDAADVAPAAPRAPTPPTFVSFEDAPLVADDEPTVAAEPLGADEDRSATMPEEPSPADAPAAVPDAGPSAAEATGAATWSDADDAAVEDGLLPAGASDDVVEASRATADGFEAAVDRADDGLVDEMFTAAQSAEAVPAEDEPAEAVPAEDEEGAAEDSPTDDFDDEAADEEPVEDPAAVVAIPRPEQAPRVPARQQQLFTPAVDEDLVREALELASGQSRVTASQLQRRLRIDYDQAVQLLAQLGARGAVELDADATQGRVIA